jgi:hypothetical protein
MDRDRQRHFKEKDFTKGKSGPVESEEKGSPEGVQSPLDEKKNQGTPLRLPSSLPPNEPSRNSHYQVKQGPNRGKDPCRRIPGRFLEMKIPVIDPNE